MTEIVYLEDLLNNYYDITNPVQCLYVELAERSQPVTAVEIIYALSMFYFGTTRKDHKGVDSALLTKQQQLDKKPRYSRNQIMTYIRGQVQPPLKLRLVCLVYLVAIVDTPELARVLGAMMGIKFNKRVISDIQLIQRKIAGTLGRINNPHLMPTRARGAAKQVYARIS